MKHEIIKLEIIEFGIKRIAAAVLVLTLLAGGANTSWAAGSESAIPQKQPAQTAEKLTAEDLTAEKLTAKNLTTEKLTAKDLTAEDQTEKAEQAPVVPTSGVLTGTETEVRTDAAVFTDIARVTVPLVELTNETAKEYPKLAESLKAYTGSVTEQRSAKTAQLEAVYRQRKEEKETDGLEFL